MPLHWTRSSYCDSAGPDCVEVASVPGPAPVVCLRDSKNPSRPALAFGPAAWSAFVGAVDRPAVVATRTRDGLQVRLKRTTSTE
ncbi:DUF397 domain-containing protein [Streptomyces sp. SID9727]|uniref:DUF397 domain-containing protein n=1 Tax=Streptomyces sp. SID9727 TaxID=2706114 RepID=UPI0013C70DC8|nr:DUF397 domain-containing protein [Streptomyces sp. SID9727]NEC66048.1 DUF397 domain-containing protein [Streptomyces sp. SID9727]